MIVKGNTILSGTTVEGEAIVQKESFSFFGDVNRETGVINVGTNAGKSFKDKILVFPQSKGSTLAPYVATDCKRNGLPPRQSFVRRPTVLSQWWPFSQTFPRWTALRRISWRWSRPGIMFEWTRREDLWKYFRLETADEPY